MPLTFKQQVAIAGATLAVAAALVAAYFVAFRPSGLPADFALRSLVSATSDLRFSFPELMDAESVQAMMEAPDGVEGTWVWRDGILIFDPTEKLPAGKTLTFRLPKSALKANGKQLGEDLEFTFVVAGPVKVAAQIPAANAKSIAFDSKITIVFDRPIVPLMHVQGDAAAAQKADWPVTISPETEGRWRWLSTVAVEFIPAKDLIPAMTYSVHVPAGIKTVAGDATEQAFDWSFETIRPEVTSTEPPEGYTLAGPKTEIVLQFTQEVDLPSLDRQLSLRTHTAPPPGSSAPPTLSGGGIPVGLSGARYGQKEVDGKKVTDKTLAVVKPSAPFAFANSYTLIVKPGVKGLNGNLGSEKEVRLNFSTAGPLSVVRSSNEYSQLSVEFTNPVDTEVFQKHVTLTPPLKAKIDWNVPEWEESRRAYAYPELAPSTKYTLTVDAEMTDIFGQKLGKPHVLTFNTPPIPAKVFTHSKGSFGIFERSKPPVFYLNAVNAKSMTAEFARLPVADFLRMRGESSRRGDQFPVPLEQLPEYQKWTLKPKNVLDTWEAVPFDLQEKLGATLRPGIFTFTLSSPEYKDSQGNPLVDRQYFVLTHISLTLKYSGNRALVWATDMQTGAPVAGATINFMSLNGETKAAGKTNAEGFFETPIAIASFVTGYDSWEPEFWVTAEKGDDFSFVSSRWSDGIRPGDFDFYPDFRHAQAPDFRIDASIYTERPIYAAGDTVHFRGMMRLRDWDGKVTIPGSDRSVQAVVTDPQGNDVWSKALPFTPFGGFSGDVPLDPKAVLGDYSMRFTLLPDGDSGYYIPGTTFSVLAYRKPEYSVEVKPAREEYFNRDTLEATVLGAYYFGAAMQRAPVSWRADRTDYYFNKFTDGWYSFALEDSWCWYDCERTTERVMEGQGTLDATGKLPLRIPLTIDDKPVSQIVTVEADVTDENNQVVSNRVSVPVHKSNIYVGVRSQDYVVAPGEEAMIGVVTVSPEGKPVGNTDVTLQLFSRVWNTIRTKGVDGEYYYENEPKDTFIRTERVTTNAEGKATAAVLIESGGQYRVVAEATDASGRKATAATGVYAFSSTYFNWPHQNHDRIEVVADKPEYTVGETAKLLVKSPFQGKGVRALVTVERDGVMTKKVIDVLSNAQAIEVPITEEMVPNAYVSVVIVKPRIGETFNEFGLDTGAPAYRVGYARLSVDTSGKRLGIGLQTNKETYLPGEKVTVTITTTDAAGTPVPAELSLGVVDMSLLALSGFEMPDPVRKFYAERGLGVYTSQMLSFLMERFKPGSKGGGGADLESRKRGNFKDTAHWLPTVVTDASGKATLSFTLPDNLTTWHLLAIGQTKQHTYGAEAKTIVATKRVVLRPVRTRFAVHGDEIELGAIVHNFLPSAQTFTVSVAGSGFTLLSNASQKVTLQPQQQQKVTFKVRVNTVSRATLRFLAAGGDARDEVEETIPVYPFGTPQTVATTGIAQEGAAVEKILVPTEKEASEGTLTATISPSIATYLPSGLEYLTTFPYGCTEQTVSGFVPSVLLSQLQGYEAFRFVEPARLENIVVTSVERISAFQRPDGGFGYWQDSPESYPYLSAYVLEALHLTKSAGFTVDAGMMQRTADYLQMVLRNQKTKEPLDLATRAYILYVLSQTGRGNASLLQNLYADRDKLPVFGRAQLAMALQNMGDRKAGSVLTELLNTARADSRGTHFEEEDGDSYGVLMHTNQRTTAIVLQAMVKIEPGHTLLPSVVRYLLGVRKDGHWDTTQSTTETLRGLIAFLQSTDELNATYKGGIQVNGKTLLEMSVEPATALRKKSVTLPFTQLQRGRENEVRIAKNEIGRLYYDLVLSYFSTTNVIPPAEEGIGITRAMTPLPGSKPKTTVGGTYDVTLTITVPEDRNFVAVESPVPAGMELVDVSLKTSQQTLLSDQNVEMWSEDYWKNGLWRFTHRELRDDRLFLFAEYLPAGVYQYHYLARATAPGTFRLRPARVWEMYFPEIFGQTAGEWFTIAGE